MATTSLGRLTLDLAVRLSEFTDGMNRAERETRDRTQNMNRAVTDFKSNLLESLNGSAVGSAFQSLAGNFSSISSVAGAAGLAIGTAGAAAAGAIVGLTKLALETAKADAEMSKMAQTAGTSVQSFQTLTHAAKQYGITQEQVSSILADMQEKLGEFTSTGGGGAADFFDQLKVRTGQTDDAMQAFAQTLQGKDGVDAVRAIKVQMDEWGITTQEQRFILESLASDLGNLQPVLAMTQTEWDAYGQSLEEAGIVKSQEAINKSIELEQQTRALTDTYDGIKNKLAMAVVPVLVDLADELTNAALKGDQLDGSMSAVDKTISALKVSIAGASTELKLWIHDISTWAYQFELTKNAVSDAFSAGSFSEGLSTLQKANQKSLDEFQRAEAKRRQIILDGQILAQGGNPKNVGKGSTKGLILKPSDVLGNKAGFGPVANGLGAGPYAPNYTPSQVATAQANAVKTGKQLLDAAEAEAKAKEKTAKATEKTSKAAKKSAEATARLVGISGNTGIGTGAHLDIRYARGDARFNTAPSAAHLARFQADGKALTSYRQTSGFGPRKSPTAGASKNHRGIDFAMPVGTKLTTSVPIKDVNTFWDAKGGGWVSNVEFQDGVKMSLLHQSPAVKGIKGGPSGGTLGKMSGAYGEADRLIEQQQREAEKAAQEQQRAAEQLAKEQQSIRERYMNEREKSVYEHNKKMAEIDEKFGAGTAEAIKYRAEEVARYQEEQAERVYSIMSKYQDEEEKLTYEYEKAKQDIRNKFAEDSPEYAIAMDRLEVFHREELQKIRQQDAKKFIQQQQHIESIRRLMQQSGYESAATVGDIIARNTMKPDDYQRYNLGSQEDSARAGVNAQYADREAEINRINELGEYEIASAGARYELLQEAKREHEEAMYAVDFEYADKRKKLEEDIQVARLDMYAGTTSAMSGLLGAFFGENKRVQAAMFAIEKGYTLAGIWLKNKKALSEAWASAPFPYNLPAVATTAIETGSLAAAAGAITPVITGGIAHGGLDYVPKESTYLLDKGERVLSPRQNQDLAKFMQGGNGGEVNITINVDAQGNSTMDAQNANQMSRQLANTIKAVVQGELRQERRQGGLFSGA